MQQDSTGVNFTENASDSNNCRHFFGFLVPPDIHRCRNCGILGASWHRFTSDENGVLKLSMDIALKVNPGLMTNEIYQSVRKKLVTPDAVLNFAELTMLKAVTAQGNQTVSQSLSRIVNKPGWEMDVQQHKDGLRTLKSAMTKIDEIMGILKSNAGVDPNGDHCSHDYEKLQDPDIVRCKNCRRFAATLRRFSDEEREALNQALDIAAQVNQELTAHKIYQSAREKINNPTAVLDLSELTMIKLNSIQTNQTLSATVLERVNHPTPKMDISKEVKILETLNPAMGKIDEILDKIYDLEKTRP